MNVLRALIVVDPSRAIREIKAAYRRAGTSQRDAALALGVAEITLMRWIRILGIGEDLAGLKERAKRDGWHHEKNKLGGRKKSARHS